MKQQSVVETLLRTCVRLCTYKYIQIIYLCIYCIYIYSVLAHGSRARALKATRRALSDSESGSGSVSESDSESDSERDSETDTERASESDSESAERLGERPVCVLHDIGFVYCIA